MPDHHVRRALDRFRQADEQLRLISHYIDREVMGRAATKSEMAIFEERAVARQKTLRTLCGAPCADWPSMRDKVRVLHNLVRDDGLTMSQVEQRALLASILNLDAKAVVDEVHDAG